MIRIFSQSAEPIALQGLRWSYVLFILYASAKTFAEGWSAHGAEGHSHTGLGLMLLAGSEILAALALLIGPFVRAAAIALLVIYAIATALSLAAGDFPLRFLYYAATALYLGQTGRLSAVTDNFDRSTTMVERD